jgi:polysaccharide biosynthesis transport protein
VFNRNYTPEEIWNLIVRYRWTILLPIAVGIAAAPLLGRFAPLRYRSEAMILVVPQQVPDKFVQPTVVESIEDRLPAITAQILSRARLERIILDMDLYKQERSRQVMEDVVQKMRTRDIETTPTAEEISAFQIGYISNDPETARRVTERLQSLYIEQNSRDRALQAESTNQFLGTQLEDAKRRLSEQEKRLEEYRRRHAGQLPSQLQGNMQQQQHAQLQLQALNEATNRAEERRLRAERDLSAAKAIPIVAPSQPQTLEAGATTAQLLDAERQRLAALTQRYTSNHPSIAESQRRITELTAQMENETPLSARGVAPERLTTAEATQQRRILELQAEIEVIDKTLSTNRDEAARLRRVIGDYQAKLDIVPTRESELVELTRDYNALNAAYTELLLKKENAAIAANLERGQIGEQFKILDEASLPERPYNTLQRWAVLSSGAIAGLLLGLAVVGLREYRDSSFRSKDEVMAALSLPVLASIPVMVSDRERQTTTRRAWAMDIGGSAVLLTAIVVVVVWQLRA